MARTTWELMRGRPIIQVSLAPRTRRRRTSRTLLADTGAGSALTLTDLLLPEAVCRQLDRRVEGTIRLGGAFTGVFQRYWVVVSIPALRFSENCRVASVPDLQLPSEFQGIACFRFLNRFTYGNFGDAARFGLETS